MPMSLNLKEMLCWAWLLPGPKGLQLAVEQPVETVGRVKPTELLGHWAELLRKAGTLNGKGELPLDDAESMDVPFAGALAHEGVGNRTLLVGPAGGFYSACCEDIYPNCWSATHAADALKKALKEPHLQDALQAYRHRWRTTLGDYLRGPQQNFRFLAAAGVPEPGHDNSPDGSDPARQKCRPVTRPSHKNRIVGRSGCAG